MYSMCVVTELQSSSPSSAGCVILFGQEMDQEVKFKVIWQMVELGFEPSSDLLIISRFKTSPQTLFLIFCLAGQSSTIKRPKEMHFEQLECLAEFSPALITVFFDNNLSPDLGYHIFALHYIFI